MASIMGESGDIFYPQLDEEKDMIPFDAIAKDLLHELGLKPDICQTDEEARQKALALTPQSTSYPIYFFGSDTCTTSPHSVMPTPPIHTPVLLQEVIDHLDIKKGGTYVDGTFGFGGHSLKIMEKGGPDCRLIGFDRDSAALARAGDLLAAHGGRLTLVHRNYTEMKQGLQELGINKVDGLLPRIPRPVVSLFITPSRIANHLPEFYDESGSG